MLETIILFLVGKSFYSFANRYHENRWLWCVLGILTYLFGAFLGTLVMTIFFPSFFKFSDRISAVLMLIPFGFTTCILLFFALSNTWEKKLNKQRDDILDGNL